jgi:hypothetical protein
MPRAQAPGAGVAAGSHPRDLKRRRPPFPEGIEKNLRRSLIERLPKKLPFRRRKPLAFSESYTILKEGKVNSSGFAE